MAECRDVRLKKTEAAQQMTKAAQRQSAQLLELIASAKADDVTKNNQSLNRFDLPILLSALSEL